MGLSPTNETISPTGARQGFLKPLSHIKESEHWNSKLNISYLALTNTKGPNELKAIMDTPGQCNCQEVAMQRLTAAGEC